MLAYGWTPRDSVDDTPRHWALIRGVTATSEGVTFTWNYARPKAMTLAYYLQLRSYGG